LSPITVLPLLVRLLRAIQLRYRDYAAVLTPALAGSAVMLVVLLALRTWLIVDDMRPVIKLALQVGAGGAAYAGFLMLFYRERLNRYARFFAALQRGNAALAGSELP
jgi:hypothetical protein